MGFEQEYGMPVNHGNPEKVIKQLLDWKKANFTMYPVDVINLLIEHSIINLYDVESIINNHIRQIPVLPTKYIKD